MAIKVKPDVRYLKEIKHVLYDRAWARQAANTKLYYMYRGVARQDGLRYDITVIPAKMLGREYVKTKGNRNSNNFPELYGVLQGKAFLFTQRRKGKTATAVSVFEMKKGDWVVLSPQDEVITINPTRQLLKTANWVSEKNVNLYKELEKMKGASYYYTKDGWIKNENYKKAAKLRFKKPLKKYPKNLNFLHGKR
jgi:glucose-6-phosphate isomerase